MDEKQVKSQGNEEQKFDEKQLAKLCDLVKQRFPELERKLGSTLKDIVSIDGDINTAEADFNKIKLGPGFMKTLDTEQQLFVLMHEIYHIIYDHVGNQGGKKDMRLWDFACDAWINAQLKRMGLKMPAIGIQMQGASEYESAEDLYKELAKREGKLVVVEEKDKDNEWPEFGYMGIWPGEEGSLDDHSKWELIRKRKEQARIATHHMRQPGIEK